jgi:hypothetical protein
MESMHAGERHVDRPSGTFYDKPSLRRLGSFRELTQDSGGILELLLGRGHQNDCAMKGSSCHAVHHGR